MPVPAITGRPKQISGSTTIGAYSSASIGTSFGTVTRGKKLTMPLRLRRPERHVVAYALDPVEMTPLVEVVPSPLTSPACTDLVCAWFEELGRKMADIEKRG